MSFDYLSDTFGESRKGKKTRFTELETTAKELLTKFVHGGISNRDFAEEFQKVNEKFHELMKNGDGYTIDEDTPLWLNSLLGFHFMDWLNYQKIKQYIEQHPEELYGRRGDIFKELSRRGYQEQFQAVCAEVLSELEKASE